MSNIESNQPSFIGRILSKNLKSNRRAVLLLAMLCPALLASPSFAAPAPDNFYAVPLVKSPGGLNTLQVIDRYGVPFAAGALKIPRQTSAQWEAQGQAKRIFLLGMTEDANLFAWAEARDHSVRFFIGDQLAEIHLNYADGSTQVFPLILGEGLWWGEPFYRFPEPFPTDRRLQKALASALRLYPPAPVADGNYLAVITPRPIPLESITIENTTDKQGTLLLDGITIEAADTNDIAVGPRLSAGAFPPVFAKFVREKSLRPLGQDEKRRNAR